MKKLQVLVFLSAMSLGTAWAQAPAAADSCEAKAVSKDGKPLAGAAKNSFMKKCKKDSMGAECEAKAVSKEGKPLAGAAKNSFMKKCMAG